MGESEPGAPPADVLLATIGTGRTQYDDESALLVAALAERGLRAAIVAWDAPVDWAAAALVVVRSSWDYSERHEQFLAWLRATAARTTVVNAAELIAWNIHTHLAGLLDDGDALIQPYVPAVAAGEVSLVLFDGVLSHAVRKLPAGGDFRVQQEHGGTVVAHAATAAERTLAAAVLAAVPAAPAYARAGTGYRPNAVGIGGYVACRS